MESLLHRVEETPTWAKDWCYFYLAASLLSALTAFLTLLMLVFSFTEIYKKGKFGVILIYVFAVILQSTNSLVTFWMCRRSLK
jgi:hypothetical protein